MIFFDDSEPLLKVESFYKENDKICDIGILTFSEKAIAWMLEHYECEKVSEAAGANGARPILQHG